MRSWGSPSSSARRALLSADTTMASRMTSWASSGSAAREFSSIRRVSRSWSRLPQFTPMRTGFSWRHAISIISANCGSRLLPRPTLPGLMRYLASAAAQAGCFPQQLVAVEVEVADDRYLGADRRRLRTSTATAAARATGLCRAALAKIRIDPGNVGLKQRDLELRRDDRDRRVDGKPVRIRGQLGQPRPGPADALMDENTRRSSRWAHDGHARGDRGCWRWKSVRACAELGWPPDEPVGSIWCR